MSSSQRRWIRPVVAMRLLCVLGLLAGTASRVYAAHGCPWMNQATASGLLEGNATLQVPAVAPSQMGICTFVDQETGYRRMLTIRVEVGADAHARVLDFAQSCGAKSIPLQAIGNEASLCPILDRKGMREERMAGRVRDQFFSIVLGTSSKNDSALHADMLRMHLLSAAELVSGNLF